MIIEEVNQGTKIDYTVRTRKITFADTILLNLAKYQRDWVVTIDVMVDAEGFLAVTTAGRRYVAELILPPIEYTEEEVTVIGEDEQEETQTERTAQPLDMDKVTLRLWSIDGLIFEDEDDE